MDQGEGAVVAANEQPAGEPQAQAAAQPRTWGAVVQSVLLQMITFYMIQSLFMGRGPATPMTNSTNATAGFANASHTYHNMLHPGQKLNFSFYISEVAQLAAMDAPLFQVDDFVYGDWKSGANKDSTYTFETSVPLTENLKHNGTLYLHGVLTSEGSKLADFSAPLVRHIKLKAEKKLRNLLSGEAEAEEPESAPSSTSDEPGDDVIELPVTSHWHENYTITLVMEHAAIPLSTIPDSMRASFFFNSTLKSFQPPFGLSTFWLLSSNMYPLNETLDTIPLQLTFQPVSLFRYLLEAQMDESWKLQQSWGTSGETEVDMVKKMLIETNPYYLGLTMVVSLLHTVFDCLAFKNDVQFWKNRKSMEGLSLKAILISLACQVIIFLYLLDAVWKCVCVCV